MYLISEERRQTLARMMTAAGLSVAVLMGAGAVAHADSGKGKHDANKIEKIEKLEKKAEKKAHKELGDDHGAGVEPGDDNGTV